MGPQRTSLSPTTCLTITILTFLAFIPTALTASPEDYSIRSLDKGIGQSFVVRSSVVVNITTARTDGAVSLVAQVLSWTDAYLNVSYWNGSVFISIVDSAPALIQELSETVDLYLFTPADADEVMVFGLADECAAGCFPSPPDTDLVLTDLTATSVTIGWSLTPDMEGTPSYYAWLCSGDISISRANALSLDTLCTAQSVVGGIQTLIDDLDRYEDYIVYVSVCDEGNRCAFYPTKSFTTAALSSLATNLVLCVGIVFIIVIVLYFWLLGRNGSLRRRLARGDDRDDLIRMQATLLAFREIDTLEKVLFVGRPSLFLTTSIPLIYFLVIAMITFLGFLYGCIKLGDYYQVIIPFFCVLILDALCFLIVIIYRASQTFTITDRSVIRLVYFRPFNPTFRAMPLAYMHQITRHFGTLTFHGVIADDRRKNLLRQKVLVFPHLSNHRTCTDTLQTLGYEVSGDALVYKMKED